MNKKAKNIVDWVQVVTGIGVIIGLILVIVEIRQSREIARLQIISSDFSITANERFTMMGENLADVMAKACEDPNEISHSDWLIISSRYAEVLNRIRRGYAYSRNSTIYSDFDWQRWTINFQLIFATKPGQEWWSQQTWVEPEIRKIGNEMLEQLDVEQLECQTSYRTAMGNMEGNKSVAP